MAPGYSKPVLGEFILPNTGAPFLASGFDWQMMVLHSGMERSQGQWREPIQGVGLEIVGCWQGREGGESIIEVVKEDSSWRDTDYVMKERVQSWTSRKCGSSRVAAFRTDCVDNVPSQDGMKEKHEIQC